jgi:hypothetical protein
MNRDRNYDEILLEKEGWQLLRKADGSSNMLFASMMAHYCPRSGGYLKLRNGTGEQQCKYCGDRIPDAIWGLWALHTADQRINREKR